MDTIGALLYNIELPELVGQYTELTYQNGVYRGACPIHGGSRTSSLCVWDSHYYCHACGATGNAIQFYSDIENLPFYQAVESLCEKYNISLDDENYQKQKSVFKENALIANRYHRNVDKALDYLKEKRGFNDKMIEEFQLGYDEGGFLNVSAAGIVIPIQDNYGRIVGFTKRAIGGDSKTPKYKNTTENDVFHKRQLLFNYHRAIKLIKGTNTLHLVEGHMDVISAHQQGVACVGYMGASLTKDQIKLLYDLQILHNGNITFVLSVDNPDVDETGKKMIVKMRESIMKYAPDLNVCCTVYPT